MSFINKVYVYRYLIAQTKLLWRRKNYFLNQQSACLVAAVPEW